MPWSHPDISLDDLLQLIKGFVDILILASGYQSSGSPANWDAENIKRAARYGLFFEEVLRRLHNGNDYNDSIQELEAAMSELTSTSHFPQGLTRLSSATLSNARDFVLKCLIQILPLKESHLNALITAAVEMDFDDLTRSKDNSIDLYIEKLILQTKSMNLLPQKRSFMTNSINSSWEDPISEHKDLKERGPHAPGLVQDTGTVMHENNSTLVARELFKRHAAVSCLCSAETSIETLLEIVSRNSLVELKTLTGIPSGNVISAGKEGKSSGLVLWSQWRSRSLSYMLDIRTIRLLSGADLIFSISREQWLHILAPLKATAEADPDILLEIIELVLLSFISGRWNSLLELLISLSFDHLPLWEPHYNMHKLLLAHQFQHPQTMNSQESDLMEYLMTLLGSQMYLLWRLPPILVAAAIPSCSILFKGYLSDIERQLRGEPSSIRYCTCSEEAKNHQSCEVAERAWCLHIVHPQGSSTA